MSGILQLACEKLILGCSVTSTVSAVALAKEDEAIADTRCLFAKGKSGDFIIFVWLIRLCPASGTTPDKYRQPYTFQLY